MINREIGEEELSAMEAEYAKWKEILNVVIGSLAFTLGVACLGTSRPHIWGLVSIVFVTLILIHIQRHFPKVIRELRAADLSKLGKFTLEGIEKRFFGLRAALTGFPGYWFGWLFLIYVAVFWRIFPGA